MNESALVTQLLSQPRLLPRKRSARTTSRSPASPEGNREVPPCSLPEQLRVRCAAWTAM